MWIGGESLLHLKSDRFVILSIATIFEVENGKGIDD